ncbi:MAG: peptide chain release factor N(5)-glutamine methyltransferase [Thermoanaerobaculia bacterium]
MTGLTVQTTIESELDRARQRLLVAPFCPPTREANLLLGHILGLDEAQLLAHDSEPLAPAAELEFARLLERRLLGEPVAYLVGTKEFYGYTFQVDRRVLIPRPETEHLIGAALSLGLPDRARILDLGTGSGCIAVTLALELPSARITAVDLSLGALVVAAANADRHGVGDRVHFAAAHLTTGLALEYFDLIVSNPPYIGPEELESLSTEIRHFEPELALIAPLDSLSVLTSIMRQCSRVRTAPPLVLEIGYGQLDDLSQLAERMHFQVTTVIEDYSGIPRTLVLDRSAASKASNSSAVGN